MTLQEKAEKQAEEEYNLQTEKIPIPTSFWFQEGDNYKNWYKKGFIAGYNNSQETHFFSERDMIEFIEWCNYPIYRAPGELGFKLRVQPQFPEYNTYIILDKNGYSLHPKGVYLTTEELLQYWKKQKIK